MEDCAEAVVVVIATMAKANITLTILNHLPFYLLIIRAVLSEAAGRPPAAGLLLRPVAWGQSSSLEATSHHHGCPGPKYAMRPLVALILS
jgi:hypothetical protein